MPALADAKPVHAKWSEVNREFLEFVERNPACLERSSYGSLQEEASLRKFSIQPWPLFMGAPQRREMERVALGMDRLVRGCIERFLGNDPRRIAQFYYSNGTMDGSPSLALDLSEDLVTLLLEEPSGLWSAPSRADYIETSGGLQFIEYNAGGDLGGLQTDAVGELYLASAPTARFLREHNRRARPSAILGALFRHVVEDTVKLGVWEGGDFNVAMAVRPHDPGRVAMHSAEAYTRELRKALQACGHPPAGQVLLCALDEIVHGRGGPTLQGHPVHIVIEQHNGQGDIRPVFRAFKLGYVNLFSGPIGEILSDKRNLVLLSEHAGSDEFSAAERALIEAHLPWTRSVAPCRTSFRGRPLRLPDDLVERRAEFVLKKASSIGGAFVEVGRYRTADEWMKAITRALWEGDWVVQEYLETVPYCFQSGSGAVRHELVWGLYVFGAHFGGAYLRLQPEGRSGGVVNNSRGADVGAVLDVID